MDHPDKVPPLVDYYSLTDRGLRRANNQDAYACVPARQWDVWEHRGHLFLVADGMGAHAAGELASKIAAEDVPLAYQKLQKELSAPEALRQAILDANQTIHQRGSRNFDFQGMGTTCTALAINPQGALVGHVGDSRAYRLRGYTLEQLTRDHSLVWELRQQGQEELFPGIPRNIITRSLGPNPEVEVDLEGPFPVLPGDKFLLCSDGLSGQVPNQWIGVILRLFSPYEAAHLLVHLANLKGGPDNITVVVVEVPHRLGDGVVAPGTAARQKSSSWAWVGPILGALLGTIVGGVVLTRIPHLQVHPAIGAVGGGVVGALLGWVCSRRSPAESQKSVSPDATASPPPGGPYTQEDCHADQPMVADLQEILKQVREAAQEEDWDIPWQEIQQLEDQISQALNEQNYDQAVHAAGKAILTIMQHAREPQA